MTGRLLLLRDHVPAGFDPAADLHRQGYAVETTGHLPRARKALDHGPDVVLLDVDLTGCAGWEDYLDLCRQRGVPCLVFSGNGRFPEALAGFAARADGVVLRTADAGEMRRRVADALRLRRLQLQLNRTRRKLRQRQREQEEELGSAAQIQQSLLPSRAPSLDTARFAWRFLPFEKVGGDLFNVQQLDEETVMVYLCDVSGHGVSSAMVTVSLYQSLSLQTGRIVKRVFVGPPYYKILSPAEVLTELEREFPFERFEKFFTIVYLLLDVGSGRVRYCSAGHPPPALIRRRGGLEPLPTNGGLIGLGVGGPFQDQEVQLKPGDRLYLYSDGITEFSGAAGTFFGSDRLFGALQALGHVSLPTGCDRVLAELEEFGGGRSLQDDVTLLGIEYRGD